MDVHLRIFMQNAFLKGEESVKKKVLNVTLPPQDTQRQFEQQRSEGIFLD